MASFEERIYELGAEALAEQERVVETRGRGTAIIAAAAVIASLLAKPAFTLGITVLLRRTSSGLPLLVLTTLFRRLRQISADALSASLHQSGRGSPETGTDGGSRGSPVDWPFLASLLKILALEPMTKASRSQGLALCLRVATQSQARPRGAMDGGKQ